jgi:hypothetical protein
MGHGDGGGVKAETSASCMRYNMRLGGAGLMKIYWTSIHWGVVGGEEMIMLSLSLLERVACMMYSQLKR